MSQETPNDGETVWLWWSSGKDSAWSLQVLNADPRYRVTGLVTTVNTEFERVAMHGVRERILQRQAAAAGLPIHMLPIPYPCPNAVYETAAAEIVAKAQAAGVRYMAFGDLFLEDVRDYRSRLLDGSGIEALFPLWGRDTAGLAGEMIDAGLEAWVTCVDPRLLAEEFVGRAYDRALLADLPDGVDPCGENGEFHTCAVAGSMFSAPIAVRRGEIVKRDGFVFADLVPVEGA